MRRPLIIVSAVSIIIASVLLLVFLVFIPIFSSEGIQDDNTPGQSSSDSTLGKSTGPLNQSPQGQFSSVQENQVLSGETQDLEETDEFSEEARRMIGRYQQARSSVTRDGSPPRVLHEEGPFGSADDESVVSSNLSDSEHESSDDDISDLEDDEEGLSEEEAFSIAIQQSLAEAPLEQLDEHLTPQERPLAAVSHSRPEPAQSSAVQSVASEDHMPDTQLDQGVMSSMSEDQPRSSLLKTQDRDYHETLEADRIKAAERRLESQRKQAEENQARSEEQAAIQRVRELISGQDTAWRDYQQYASDGPYDCMIRFNLHKPVRKNFHKTDPVKIIFDWFNSRYVDRAETDQELKKFSLAAPAEHFKGPDRSIIIKLGDTMTLEEAKVCTSILTSSRPVTMDDNLRALDLYLNQQAALVQYNTPLDRQQSLLTFRARNVAGSMIPIRFLVSLGQGESGFFRVQFNSGAPRSILYDWFASRALEEQSADQDQQNLRRISSELSLFDIFSEDGIVPRDNVSLSDANLSNAQLTIRSRDTLL